MTAIIHNARWKLVSVLMLSIIVSFFDRMNVSYSLPKIAEEFGWNLGETARNGGWILSVFFIFYGLGNLTLTPVIRRFGSRKTLLGVIILWSIFTCIGLMKSRSLFLLLLTRAFLGLAESPHYPLMNNLSRNWFPLHERSRGNSVWAAGMPCAMILGPLLFVPLTDHFGWRIGFLTIAIAGTLLTWPLAYYYVHDSPIQHPRISTQEKDYIGNYQEASQSGTADGISKRAWQRLFNANFILLCLASIPNYIIIFGVISWIPTWLSKEKNMDYGTLAWVLLIPYALLILGLLVWSYIGDRLNRRSQVTAVACLGMAACCAMAGYATDRWISIIFISATIFFSSAYNSAEFSLLQHIVPVELTIEAGGIYNGVAILVGGGLGPVVTGYLANSTKSFSMAILYLSPLALITSALMGVLGYYMNHTKLVTRLS